MCNPLSLEGLSQKALDYLAKQKEQWQRDEAAGVHRRTEERIRAQVAAMPKSDYPIEWYLRRRYRD
jgi:hypothetical protein